MVLDFTFKFIASVSSCPFLDYNCKKEVLVRDKQREMKERAQAPGVLQAESNRSRLRAQETSESDVPLGVVKHFRGAFQVFGERKD